MRIDLAMCRWRQLVVLGFYLAVLPAAAIPAIPLRGYLTAHDPSTIIRCKNRYYLFYTEQGIATKSSADNFLVARATGFRQSASLDHQPGSRLCRHFLGSGHIVFQQPILSLLRRFYLWEPGICDRLGDQSNLGPNRSVLPMDGSRTGHRFYQRLAVQHD